MTGDIKKKLADAAGGSAGVRQAAGQGSDSQEKDAAVLKTLQEISVQAKAQHDVLVSIASAPIFSGRNSTPAETAAKDAAATAAKNGSAEGTK
jgi:hypothetical protein